MSTGISSLSCAFDSYLQDEVVPKAVEIFKVDPQNDGQDPEMEEEEETMAPGKSSQKSTHHDMVERRGWELRKKGKKQNYSWYSVQGPGRMAQTPQAGTGDSVSRFRGYHCSTVINYDSYFPVGEQFCIQLLFTT